MSLHENIERQEREFKDLLQRVMQAPLSPLADSVDELKGRMDRMEQLVCEIRDVDLISLSLGAEETGRQIRALNSIIEKTPREIQDVLQPLFKQLHALVEQSAQQSSCQLTDLAGNLALTEQYAANHASALKDAIAASQGRIESSQQRGVDYLVNHQQTTLGQLHTECESLRVEVDSRLTEQSADGKRAVARVQELLSLHRQELEQQSANGLRQLSDEADTRMSQHTQSIAQLQNLLSAQQEQLESLQQQQAISSDLLRTQMQHAMLRIQKWTIASLCIAAACFTGVVALTVAKL